MMGTYQTQGCRYQIPVPADANKTAQLEAEGCRKAISDTGVPVLCCGPEAKERLYEFEALEQKPAEPPAIPVEPLQPSDITVTQETFETPWYRTRTAMVAGVAALAFLIFTRM